MCTMCMCRMYDVMIRGASLVSSVGLIASRFFHVGR